MRGQVQIYNQMGKLFEELYTDDIVLVYTGFPPVVAFVDEYNDHLLTTILPFIMVDEDVSDDTLDEKRTQMESVGWVSLLGIGGQMAREFEYTHFENISGLFRFWRHGEQPILTTFPFVLTDQRMEKGIIV